MPEELDRVPGGHLVPDQPPFLAVCQITQVTLAGQLDQPTGNVLETALAASLRWGRTCLSLAVENPLNRTGNTFAYGNPFRLATPQYTPQAPVRGTAMLTYRF